MMYGQMADRTLIIGDVGPGASDLAYAHTTFTLTLVPDETHGNCLYLSNPGGPDVTDIEPGIGASPKVMSTVGRDPQRTIHINRCLHNSAKGVWNVYWYHGSSSTPLYADYYGTASLVNSHGAGKQAIVDAYGLLVLPVIEVGRHVTVDAAHPTGWEYVTHDDLSYAVNGLFYGYDHLENGSTVVAIANYWSDGNNPYFDIRNAQQFVYFGSPGDGGGKWYTLSAAGAMPGAVGGAQTNQIHNQGWNTSAHGDGWSGTQICDE
jgi:hypothetical protein